MDCSCDASCCSDEESPELFEQFTRKARKDHICFECGRVIKSKEIYEEVRGLWDGHFSRFKTCSDCLSVRTEFFHGGYEFGRIWETLAEYINNCDGDIPETCIVKVSRPARTKIATIIDRYLTHKEKIKRF